MMPRTRAGIEVDIVDARPEVGDQLELWPELGDQRAVDAVGDRRNQHVRRLGRLGQFGLAHRLVIDVEPRIEQLAHARFHRVGQLARHHHHRFLVCCRHLSSARAGGSIGRAAPVTPLLLCLTEGRANDKKEFTIHAC
jgi:hypothetical protein